MVHGVRMQRLLAISECVGRLCSLEHVLDSLAAGVDAVVELGGLGQFDCGVWSVLGIRLALYSSYESFQD